MIKHFFFLILTFAIMLVSCSDESQDEVIPRSAVSDQILENTNTVVTDKGEVIVLEDSTVYTVTLSDDYVNTDTDDDDWRSLQTRASNDSYPKRITVKGYDRKEQFGGYKKIIFSDAEKYGLHKGSIYLVCFYKVYKELAQNDNETIKPRNYNNNLDNVAMGWIPDEYDKKRKLVKGLTTTTNSINGFVTASTILRFIKCDISGASYNKFIPYTPQNLVWQYVLNYSESWD